MFNSISQQLNNYNTAQSRLGHAPTTTSGNFYFPIASQFSQFVQRPITATPVDGPYRYYQPKSKIGQLNQRIEEEQYRRQSLRKRVSSKAKDGYLSDSQRSQSSYRSIEKRQPRYRPSQVDEQPTHRRLQSDSNRFATTQPILQQEHQPCEPQQLRPKKLTTFHLPPRPTTFASDVSDGSQSSQRHYRPEYRTEEPLPNYFSQKQSPIKYPSFRKPTPKDLDINHRPAQQDIFYDAESNHSRNLDEPFRATATPPTFSPNPTPNFTERYTQPARQYYPPPTPEPQDVKSPITYNTANLPQRINTTLDRNSNFAKMLGLGIIVVVLLLMIYEIIR